MILNLREMQIAVGDRVQRSRRSRRKSTHGSAAIRAGRRQGERLLFFRREWLASTCARRLRRECMHFTTDVANARSNVRDRSAAFVGASAGPDATRSQTFPIV
jgi:hypothetical protein